VIGPKGTERSDIGPRTTKMMDIQGEPQSTERYLRLGTGGVAEYGGMTAAGSP
jgi:hypothetical protein